MFDRQGVLRPCAVSFAIALALGLSACGGGGGANIRPLPPPPADSGSQAKGGTDTPVLTGTHTDTSGATVQSGTLEIVPGATIGTGDIIVDNILIGGAYPSPTLQVDSGVSLSNHIVLGRDATLDNAGVLSGTEGTTVEGRVYAFAEILNHDGGSIDGTDSAIIFSDGGNVVNSTGGRIEGGSLTVELSRGGAVSNDGVASVIRASTGIAVQVSAVLGLPASVENTDGATIVGGTTAVYLPYGGEVTNGSGSTIRTTGTTGGDCPNTGSCSIFVSTEAMDGYSDKPDNLRSLTLTNAGTIIGNVQMNPAAQNFATLWAGSSIQGDLDMGTKNSSLILDGEAGTTQLYSQAVTGTITVTGSLNKLGDGTWIIDNDSLSGVYETAIGGGTLQVGTGGNEGSISQGPVLIGGSLVFDRSDDVIFGGDITGSGSLVQAGAGTLILTGRQVDPGTIKINSGTLQIGNGSFMFRMGSNIENDGLLVFDSDGGELSALVIDNVISGTGALIKQGAGTAILSFANTYTGGTTVNNGVLKTAGILPGNVVVNQDGVLDGSARFGVMPGFPGAAGNLSNAGKVAIHDGDSVVGGDYTQASTGTLAISLGSKLDVTGMATLDGGTLEVTGTDTGYVSNSHTDVLTATGGVSGTFAQLVKDTGVVFTATAINYDANNVWLDTTGLDITVAAAGEDVSYTPASMGSAVRVQGAFEQLNQKIAAGNTGDVSGDFLRNAGTFQQAPSLRAAQASLESLSGELHAASAAMTFAAIDASTHAVNAHLDRLLDGGGGTGMWTDHIDGSGSLARSGFDGVAYNLDGWLTGSDRRLGPSTVAGFAFGQSQGTQRLDGRLDRNRGRDTVAMLYAGWTGGRWYAQGRFGLGNFHQTVTRELQLGDSYQGVWTDYDGRYGVAYGEGGLRFTRGSITLMPFADLQYARIGRDGFAEQGAGGFGLREVAQTLDRWQAGVGLRGSRHWNLSGGRSIDLGARVEWQHTLRSHGDAFDASFVGLEEWQPLGGVGLARDIGQVGLDLDASLSDHTSLRLGADYLHGDRIESTQLTARYTLAF